MDDIIQRLDRIESLLESQNLIRKEVLNLSEASQYLELSHSHLYKLTSSGSIPHYKPNGKKLYFNRAELDQWLQRNRQSSTDEIEEAAANYVIHNNRKQ